MKPILGRLLFAAMALLGLGLVAAGIVQIHDKESGRRVQATVVSCVTVVAIHPTDQCTASWISGGSLVGGNGHVVEGPIDDANSDDIGKTLEVRIRGGQAYTASLRVPIILIVIGLWIAVMGAILVVKVGQPTARSTRKKPSGPAGVEI